MNWKCYIFNNSKPQTGSAAMETILVMPILILLIIATIVSLKLLLLNLHNRADARTTVWKQVMHSVPCKKLPLQKPSWSGSYGKVQEACFKGDIPDSHRVYPDVMATMGGKPVPSTSWVSVISEAELAAGSMIPIQWVDTYTLDGIPSEWAQGNGPGYDGWLDSELDSEVLFVDPSYFPGAQ